MTNSTRKNSDALQDRFALRAVSYLASGATDLPHDVTERLRAARFQALAVRKIAKMQTASQISSQGKAGEMAWGGDENSHKFARVAAFLSLALLMAGLLFINITQGDNRAQELADVDVALLTDALPPAAFSDPGFVQFLKVTP